MTDPTGPAEPITPADTEPSAATRRPEGTPPTSDLWSRLKQHKVVQWTLAYVALAYTLLHGAEMLGGALGWPHGLQRVLALALILGTPIVAVVAWYHGARGQQRVMGTELLIVASLLALGGTYIWRAQSARETHMTAIDNAAATTSLAAPAEASIAVLAFADMSPGKDQEYFSDGMAEEILNALAKVPGLKVAGRTSSFSFKGKNIDSKTIGETLDVAQILEGSVRKQGERVRITAQLLRAKDGFNVWSDSYDGTLADIFDLQERIARDIAGHLKVVLVSQDSRLVPKATNNTAAYTAFVEAEGLVNRRQDLTHAIDLLSDATTLDPRFARAWSKLAVANAVAPLYSDLSWPAGWAAGEAAVRHALALDPAKCRELCRARLYVPVPAAVCGNGRRLRASDSA